MPQISRGRALAYIGLLLLALTLAGRFAFRAGDGGGGTAIQPAALRAAPTPARKLLVHVVGAVHSPGLYRLDDGSRIDDAITAAGGPKPKAALELVNLASPVADGQQVVVPVRGSESAASGTSTGTAPGERVHLNTATLEELDALPGIGPVTAQKILDYRTEHGAFSSVQELDAVPGIGPARLAELEKQVDL
jgi:competence protein ComEA